jgi:UDP-glucose 4-epimerase
LPIFTKFHFQLLRTGQSETARLEAPNDIDLKKESKKMSLVTGGAGYITSHVYVELLQVGYAVVVLDNFSNSHPECLLRVEPITGRKINCVVGDARDLANIEATLRKGPCTAVIYFNGLKAVRESVENPLARYDNNEVGAHRLRAAVQNCRTKTLIFGSSAAVDGKPQHLPHIEDHPLSAASTYGHSKLIVEQMSRNPWGADTNWAMAILLYFNPIGAYEIGLISEDLEGIPNNLMPYLAQVAVGRREPLKDWRNDYPTHDGASVRDYIVVVGLAGGRQKDLGRLELTQCITVNLGAGVDDSVLDVVKAFETASGQTLSSCGLGDIAACYAGPNLAGHFLGWKAERDPATMFYDHWRWQEYNPRGFARA